RVEGVDRGLRVGRTGDLHPSVLETRPGTCHAPTGILAYVSSIVAKLWIAAIADLEAAALAVGEPIVTPTRELPVQVLEELEGVGRENGIRAIHRLPEHLNAGRCGCGGRNE